MELATNIPFVHSIISSSFMQALAGPKPEDKAGLGAIIGVAQKVVAERFDPKSEKPSQQDRDMLDAFIWHGLSQLECESEALLQILAGSDSTATSIRMTFLLLLTNPAVYSKLRTEIDTAISAGNISFPIVKSSEAQNLPYLQACIKEGLRLWQPLNGIVTKDAPREGVTINGVWIPGGTQVCLSQHSMMRRKDLFGPDAEMFRPERWVEGDADTIKGYEKVWDYTFSAGRFLCLGKGIALMELNKAVLEVCSLPLVMLRI
jgi:cytochrome P450